jgi:hypothetical protein
MAAAIEYTKQWTADVTQRTDITVLGENFVPAAVDSDKLITINLSPVELKMCLGYSSKWNPLTTDAEGSQSLPDVVLRLAEVIGDKLDKVHTDLLGKTGLPANSRTFKDDVDNDISSFARIFLNDISFSSANNGAGSVFDTSIPKVAIRSIDEKQAVATPISTIFGNLTTLSAPTNVITALHSLFEQAVAANRIHTSGSVAINGVPGFTSAAFQEGDSITVYIDYTFAKKRSYTVDGQVTTISGVSGVNAKSAIVSLTIGGETFNIDTATVENSNLLTHRYAFKLLASANNSRWESSYLLTSLWTKTIAGGGNSQGNSTTLDSQGNLYVCGFYDKQTSTTDLGNGVILPASISGGGGSKQDAFLIKYNPAGVAQWVKTLPGGWASDSHSCVKTDSLNNVYVCGYYSSTTLTLGAVSLPATGGGSHMHLIKYGSDGTPLWAKGINATSSEGATAIGTDSDNNVYMCGYYSSTSAIALGNNISLPISVGQDSFLVKYNLSGTAQWAKGISGTTSSENALSIAIDSLKNIYVGGQYSSTSAVALGNNISLPLTSNQQGFLIKYNSEGDAQWAKSIGGLGTSDIVQDVVTDFSDNVYVCGQYTQAGTSVRVELGNTITLPVTPNQDVFLIKYDSQGDAQMAKTFSTSNSDSANTIATDIYGNIYIAGYYRASSIVTIGNNVTLPIASSNSAFLVKYDSAGIPQWATAIDGTLDDNALGLEVNSLGHIYMTGPYRSISSITIKDVTDSNTLVNSLNVLPASSSTINNMYLVKFAQ